MTTAPQPSSSCRDALRHQLTIIFDSETIAALASIFGPRHALIQKGYSEQVVDLLLPRFTSLTPQIERGVRELTGLIEKAMDEWENEQEASDTVSCAQHVAITLATLSPQAQALIEECASIADDHTPAKHDGTLAAHVTGSTIAKAIRALLTRGEGK